MKVKLKLKPFIMKIKNIIWLAFLFLVTFQSFSQVKKNSAGFVYPPKDFTKTITDKIVRKYSSSTINWNKTKFNDKGAWKVYSVRDNNIVGLDNKPIDIRFKQEMSVKGFVNSQLQVLWVDFSGDIHEGLIDCADVFMWQNSLSGKNGFPRKALVLSKLSSETSANNAAWSFYNHPDCRSHNQIKGEFADNLEIFFILKETDDSYLLCKSSKDGSLMRGWMKKKHITEWPTRVAYDISVGAEANNKYLDKKIPIFSTYNHLEKFIKDPLDLSVYKPIRVETCKRELDPQYSSPFNRPLLLNMTEFDKNSDSKRELIVVVNKDQNDQITIGQMNDERRKLQIKSRKINILFVIDATRSMQSNITAVKNSILSFNNELRERNITDIDFKVALTLYKDVEDDALMVVNKLPLIPIDAKDNGEYRWEKAISEVVCSSAKSDYTHEEQVYSGLYQGISSCGFIEHETNIVILIGDAGNDDAKSEKTLEDIDALLNGKMNIDLYVFQSSNRLSPAFESFSDDAMHWMGLISEDPNNNISYVQDDGLTIVNAVPNDNTLYVSRGTFITQVERSGNTVDPEVLIDKLTDYLLKSLDNAKTKIMSLSPGQGKPLPDEAIRIIADVLNISVEEANRRMDNNVDVSIPGYTSMVYYDQFNEDNPVHCYQPYIFLTSGELEDIENLFLELGADPDSDATAKKNLQAFILEQLLKFHGLDRNDFNEENPLYDKIMGQTVQQAWQEILNVDFVFPKIAKTKISSLPTQDSKQFNNELNAFYSSVAAFKFSKRDLIKYRWSISESSKSDSEKFYWIPANKFPGMSKD